MEINHYGQTDCGGTEVHPLANSLQRSYALEWEARSDQPRVPAFSRQMNGKLLTSCFVVTSCCFTKHLWHWPLKFVSAMWRFRTLRISRRDHPQHTTLSDLKPNSVLRVLDLDWSHRQMVTTIQKNMSGHFPIPSGESIWATYQKKWFASKNKRSRKYCPVHKVAFLGSSKNKFVSKK